LEATQRTGVSVNVQKQNWQGCQDSNPNCRVLEARRLPLSYTPVAEIGPDAGSPSRS
jgi:hypothetical protein